MHQYLSALGFRIENKKELQALLNEVEQTFHAQTVISYPGSSDFCEYHKLFGPNIGLAICGDIDKDEVFRMDYYFPFFEGRGITTSAPLTVERKIDKEQYVGICEDPNVGISLIFSMQNGVEYMKEVQMGFVANKETSVTLSGLALTGVVLLPVQKSETQIRSEKLANENRKSLINAARGGDPTAMESLTLEDIDIYTKVSRRLVSEDVFSIVDSYFMPYGVECDLYAVLGEIIGIREVLNEQSGEGIYIIQVDINELKFEICVPAKDLLGEPAIGRRLKCNIWLQGRINFD